MRQRSCTRSPVIVSSLEDDGTYYSGELTFDESTGRRYYGSVGGTTLIIEDQGARMVYRRY